jgi:hypothetical protein
MKTITNVALTLAMITAASAQNQTAFRDASGRTTGTVTTARGGPPGPPPRTAMARRRSAMRRARPPGRPPGAGDVPRSVPQCSPPRACSMWR